jgi:hypothetical protein
MTAHEPVTRTEDIQPGSDRSFGLTIGIVLFLISGYLYMTGSAAFAWVGLAGAALVLAGLIAPRFLHPLNRAWTKLSLLLGRVMTPIIMAVVYFLTVFPIGLALRLSGKDPLSLKRGTDRETYWVMREPPGPAPESLKDQF